MSMKKWVIATLEYIGKGDPSITGWEYIKTHATEKEQPHESRSSRESRTEEQTDSVSRVGSSSEGGREDS